MAIGRRLALGLGLAALLIGALAPVASAASERDGAVYSMSNAVAGNRILVWDRHPNGSLQSAASVATGGLGTGAGLGNQGGLVLSRDGDWLYAVNAGSNQVSVLRADGTHLSLASVSASGGTTPISVTANGRWLYVLNAGGSGNIAGFVRGHDGTLASIPGSVQPLSQAAPGPAQISFSPDGRHLVVSEKGTNRLTVYTVDEDGVAGAPHAMASAGQTPFGFAFASTGTLVVSEAFGGAPGASALSSYRLGRHGILHVLSASVPDTQSAACWVTITRNGRYVYTTNTGSGTVSGYRLSNDGNLTLLNAGGVTASVGAGSTPIDVALDGPSRHLYVLLSGTHAIARLRVAGDGSLIPLGQVTGIPGGANGLAAE